MSLVTRAQPPGVTGSLQATSALDEDSQAAVQTALDKLIASGGATVVLVAHRLSTVMNADKIAVIDKGQVMEEGNHDELLATQRCTSAQKFEGQGKNPPRGFSPMGVGAGPSPPSRAAWVVIEAYFDGCMYRLHDA